MERSHQCNISADAAISYIVFDEISSPKEFIEMEGGHFGINIILGIYLIKPVKRNAMF